MPGDFFEKSKTRALRTILLRRCLLCSLLCAASLPVDVHAQDSSANPSTWTVTIVLPPRLVAGSPATLAVLDVNGRLAPGITVDIGNNQHVTTDTTGRAFFSAPSLGDVLIAKASGASAAALIDPLDAVDSNSPTPAGGLQQPAISPTVSVRDRFPICAPGFSGNADADRVSINDQRALVLAASPECIVVLPGPYSLIGPAKIAMDAAGKQWIAKTTLVSLEFAAPNPPLMPGKKSVLTVEARGSDQPLRLIVENDTPGVLRFRRGETQELFTSGGSSNIAAMEVEANRAGDYSFHARPLPAPDAEIGRRYLLTAAPFAPKDLQSEIKRLASRLAGNKAHGSGISEGGAEKVRLELQGILASTIPGDLRTLLDAAYNSL